jgi:hypothetical protein
LKQLLEQIVREGEGKVAALVSFYKLGVSPDRPVVAG